MPRAHRIHLPGYVWHLTQRGHRQQFLLRFARDRQAVIGRHGGAGCRRHATATACAGSTTSRRRITFTC